MVQVNVAFSVDEFYRDLLRGVKSICGNRWRVLEEVWQLLVALMFVSFGLEQKYVTRLGNKILFDEWNEFVWFVWAAYSPTLRRQNHDCRLEPIDTYNLDNRKNLLSHITRKNKLPSNQASAGNRFKSVHENITRQNVKSVSLF